MDGDKIQFTAPGGHDFFGPSHFHDAVTMDKGLSQGSGGGGDAEFGGNVKVTGTSEAADHISDGISGKDHDHMEQGDGKPTSKPRRN